MLNVRNNDGVSAILCAAQHGNAEWIAELVEQGADVNTTDRKGNTALIHTVMCEKLHLY